MLKQQTSFYNIHLSHWFPGRHLKVMCFQVSNNSAGLLESCFVDLLAAKLCGFASFTLTLLNIKCMKYLINQNNIIFDDYRH